MHRAVDRLRSLRVRDVMTRQVIALAPQQSLDEAAGLFESNEISSAPVVDRQGQCVGVLSSVDFLKKQPAGQREGERKDLTASGLVRDRMSAHVLSVGPDELLLKAANLMCARHVHRLPVVGSDRRLEGLISTMDIVSALVNAIDEADAVQFGVRTDDS